MSRQRNAFLRQHFYICLSLALKVYTAVTPVCLTMRSKVRHLHLIFKITFSENTKAGRVNLCMYHGLRLLWANIWDYINKCWNGSRHFCQLEKMESQGKKRRVIKLSGDMCLMKLSGNYSTSFFLLVFFLCLDWFFFFCFVLFYKKAIFVKVTQSC